MDPTTRLPCGWSSRTNFRPPVCCCSKHARNAVDLSPSVPAILDDRSSDARWLPSVLSGPTFLSDFFGAFLRFYPRADGGHRVLRIPVLISNFNRMFHRIRMSEHDLQANISSTELHLSRRRRRASRLLQTRRSTMRVLTPKEKAGATLGRTRSSSHSHRNVPVRMMIPKS